ncbi:Lrp/AsnC family transcriptional regulator [archaeon]|jgi:Lrp/AsnC family transcriptional regulator, leucine-responsive regulatory protein|nr:Lrp/AsnC family transcriptional regulator [archaeon]MBT3731209.1 Lrp/AsnC family transcriptional regulator [archaeon]MBT4670037.1 Lrp/AsnC family transcriptional regulator [archaeon]MBT5287761.1 Lrp/AsnC family transcriptional regulator [archaeon]MBT7052766.1 Lrp/AsnC family transcriptional regulator [archaeon]
MKTTDQLIISLLRENSRMTLTNMSKKTKIPVSTLHEKLKQFKQGLIKKHTSIIDFNQLGFNARANVLFKVERKQKEELKEILQANFHTNKLYKVNNGFDYIAELIFKDMRDLENFLDEIKSDFNMEDMKTFYVIDELIEEDFLSKYSPLFSSILSK